MLIDDKTKEVLKDKFERELREIVDIKVFTRNIILGTENSQYAQFSKDLVQELSQIDDKIRIEFLSLEDEEAKRSNLTISPTILIGKDSGYLIEYWGAPAGQEAGVFIEVISMVSQGESRLSNLSKGKLETMDKDVLSEVYITPNCPYCPRAVLLSHQIAIEVPRRVTSRCIEAQEVMMRARTFNVSSVPQQVINESRDSITIGVQPEEKFVNQIISYGSSQAEEIFAKEMEEREKREILVDSPNEPIVLSSNNFDKAINKYSFLVIDCWAEWCNPCRIVSPIVENLANKYQGKIVFGKLDVDKNQEIASRFGIMSIPTMLIFKNGEKIDTIVGALPEDALEEKISMHR